ncbi:phage tail protein [Lysobacter arvi]|uniref:Phage tail protein n=1 Tax=Lysobacter arvi TaxID=3038776 RepID=A0ABU1CB86_9GAMM|nr:phage tail protein [Lysobacter arvi]MDR0182408.1 phage tail protein [Lysobacter arvi]
MTNSEPLDPTRWAHSYDPVTREYLGPIRVFLSDADGTYPLPEHAVDFAPGAARPRTTFRLEDAGNAWIAVPDHRGAMLWEKATCLPAPNTLHLGERIPAALTPEIPHAIAPAEPKRNAWDAASSSWILIPDFSQHTLWDKTTGAMAAPIAAGESLPAHLTPTAPPPDLIGRARWDAETTSWNAISEAVPDAPSTLSNNEPGAS